MAVDDIVPLDFETRSKVNLKTAGSYRYARDESTQVLTASFRLPGMAAVTNSHRGPHLNLPWANQAHLDALLDHVHRGGRVRAWNAIFEYLIWNYVCVPKYGWPELKLEQMIDTMAVAAAHNLPQGLEKCGEALGISEEKLKSKRGKYLIQRLCCEQKATKHQPARFIEDAELFGELVGYCDQDVVAEETIGRKLRPLTDAQQRAWVLTQRINLRGVPLSLTECTAFVQLIDFEKDRLNKELRALTGRAVTAATKRDDLLAWCNQQMSERIELVEEEEQDEELAPLQAALAKIEEWQAENVPEFANLRKKTVEEALERDDLPDGVRRALEIRAAVTQTSTAKYAKMLKIVADDSTLKNLYVWHGAGTGRWASRGGVNAQNFARPVLSERDIELAFQLIEAGKVAPEELFRRFHLLFGDDLMDAAKSCLRGVLAAPPGYDLIDADFSSIENRMAAFIAGQWDKLELFAKGLDEYKTFASTTLYKVPYEAVTKDQRQFTKPVILGGIFGLGAKGLVAYAEQYNVQMSLPEAEAAIKGFRLAYRQVRDCWYDCGDASIAAVRNPGMWIEINERLSMICHKNFLWLKLPSGRLICWSRPKVELKQVPWMEKFWVGYDKDGQDIYGERPAWKEVVTVESIDTKTRLYKRHPLIGSSIFQSAVQGAAADVLTEGTFHTEEVGYSTVMLTHDENTALVPEGWGDPDEFGQLLCTPKPWRLELPLSYEAYRAKRFRK